MIHLKDLGSFESVPDLVTDIINGNITALESALNSGWDIAEPVQIGKYSKYSPLQLALVMDCLPSVKWLVEHGADVTITEKDGMRPYSIAIEKGNMEMAEYFKNLEPAEYHDKQNKMNQLKPFKLPKGLVSFLEGDTLYFELPDSDFISIEFLPLLDTVPFKWGRRKLLRLSKELGEYNDYQIVWDPKSKKISCYDMEHQELRELCKFDEFMADMSGQLETLF